MIRSVLVGVLAALCVVFLLLAVHEHRRGNGARTITVSGSATVSGVPTLAEFDFGVTTSGKTAAAASSANATKMTKVIAALKAHGVAAGDIQTSGISLSQETNEAGKIIGFSAENDVDVQLTVSKSGATVDAVVAAGANNVSGPTFTSGDEQQIYRKALGEAALDARGRAQAIADALGKKLGGLQTLSEQSSAPTPEPFQSAIASKAATTPVEPGKVKTEADVTATFFVS